MTFIVNYKIELYCDNEQYCFVEICCKRSLVPSNWYKPHIVYY